MEVLSCSGVQYIGQSDCHQENSGNAFMYDGQSNCLDVERKILVADGRLDCSMLNVEDKHRGKQSERCRPTDELPALEGNCNTTPYLTSQLESETLTSVAHHLKNASMIRQNQHTEHEEPCLATEDSRIVVNVIESELPSNNQETGSSLYELEWLEQDGPVALWVKWRAKWQAGIRCARADWPLPSLKAKPVDDRKKYTLVFLPDLMNYSWVDVLLVCPIDEFPQPVAYSSHHVGLEMVKDLTVVHRFIMKKLVVGMSSIIDQLRTEVLISAARNIITWKEYAKQVSLCNEYSDLGRMLLKLQKMILLQYISSEWRKYSFHSWSQRCQNAHSAEGVDILKEELTNSILWEEVNSLRDVSLPSKFGSEWKSWKHEVVKWLSMSWPIFDNGDIGQRRFDGPVRTSIQASRKRPKLEVRRAESHAPQVETKDLRQNVTVAFDSESFDGQKTIEAVKLAFELSKEAYSREGIAPRAPVTLNDKGGQNVFEVGSSDLVHTKDMEHTPVNKGGDGCSDVIQTKSAELTPMNRVEAGNSEAIQTKDVTLTQINEMVARKSLDTGNKYRQCAAFIESKGRQCVRSANDGDVYCCVHLASRFVGNSARAERALFGETQMCEGTTTLGARCKHRSLYGSSFCKKHNPQHASKKILDIPENRLERKHEEGTSSTKPMHSMDMVIVGKTENPLKMSTISVMEGDAISKIDCSSVKPEQPSKVGNNEEIPRCIGSYLPDGNSPCLGSPKKLSLYCDKHLPSWLKRARNGKSRIISKEVFVDLLKDCHSQDQKLNLHLACELFYRLFKSVLSLRNQVPKEIQLQWALSEASKEHAVGEFLMKLVCIEKERLQTLWGFNADEDAPVSFSITEEAPPSPLITDVSHDNQKTSKCKLCSEEFLDDNALGNHWMHNHKKEAQWLFRGYACAICLDPFTNKKILESHVQERHHVQYFENCMLLRCIPCGSHFGNLEELWLHVHSAHLVNFRQTKESQQHSLPAGIDSLKKIDLESSALVENSSENQGGLQKFICKFCGLKFDLLPDLGRHHQAAHMVPNSVNSHDQKKGVHFYSHKLKSGRLGHQHFKKGLGAASYRIRKRASENLKKRIQASKSVSNIGIALRPNINEAASLGRLAESQCSAVARILFSEIRKTECRPNNFDILSIARSTCCKVGLQATLKGKYGVLPERLYLKAAKLCSEHKIHLDWHREGFICPKGCQPNINLKILPHLASFSNSALECTSSHLFDPLSSEWEMDESHYIIDSRHFSWKHMKNTIVLCDDISLGKESVPVVCVVDECLLESLRSPTAGTSVQNARFCLPWKSFTYVVKPFVDQSVDLNTKSLQLGCACPDSICHPDTCDHVYLFDTDCEDAKDIYGKPMQGRFPYDKNGQIILEEGNLVYECNHMCSCTRTCPNRVLQNGVCRKLEVFKTEKKGWAVRAGESILRGTFVCEFIGEVLDELVAGRRYDGGSCSYFYKIDAHNNDINRVVEQVQFVIDATKYGNVSRFINHSCSPNLMMHHVLVESMDLQLVRIGFYARQDIALGEELTYDYRLALLPGEGSPCYCGSSNCRGRLY